MARLGSWGFGLLLDDFGTGWSSLKYILRLPIIGVKIECVVPAALLAGCLLPKWGRRTFHLVAIGVPKADRSRPFDVDLQLHPGAKCTASGFASEVPPPRPRLGAYLVIAALTPGSIAGYCSMRSVTDVGTDADACSGRTVMWTPSSNRWTSSRVSSISMAPGASCGSLMIAMTV